MQPKVVKGKPKTATQTSYLSSASNVAYSAFSYLSGAVSTPETNKDPVTFTKFEDIELAESSPPSPCLLIGFMTGFQIWDLSQSVKILSRAVKKVDLKVTEIMSEHGYNIQDLCVFNRIKESSNGNEKSLGLQRPLIGVVSESSDKSSNSKLVLYSIISHTQKKSLEFLSPILNVICNDKAIFIVCNEYAILLDVETFEKKYYIPLYRGMSPTAGVCALGPCWFAFQSPHALGDHIDPSSQNQNSVALPTIYSVASNIIELSSSIKTQLAPQISAYLGYTSTNNENGSNSPPKTNMFSNGMTEDKGLITIIDIENKNYSGSENEELDDDRVWQNSNIVVVGSHDETREKKFLADSFKRQLNQDNTRSIHHHFRVISQFRASDDGALSAIAFNRPGTLLATSSETGKEIRIYTITPTKHNIFEAHHLLYICPRGVSMATIKKINFSNDSLLVSCTSSNKGTIHFFGINPMGGEVNVKSHVTKLDDIDYNNQDRNTPSNSFKIASDTYETCIAPKIGILHSTSEYPAGENHNSLPFSTMSVKILPKKSECYYIMMIDHSENLSAYSLQLEAETLTGAEQKLNLAINPKFEWPLPRNTQPCHYSPAKRKLSIEEQSQNLKKDESNQASWMQHIEKSPFIANYLAYTSTSDFPIEVYEEKNSKILELTDPLKIDKAYENLIKIAKKILNEKDSKKEDTDLLKSSTTNNNNINNSTVDNSNVNILNQKQNEVIASKVNTKPQKESPETEGEIRSKKSVSVISSSRQTRQQQKQQQLAKEKKRKEEEKSFESMINSNIVKLEKENTNVQQDQESSNSIKTKEEREKERLKAQERIVDMSMSAVLGDI